MLRLLRWLLPLLLVVAGPAWAAPVELSLWHAYRGDERAALESLVEGYNAAHPEVKVVPLAVPYDSYFSKLEAAAPRGNGPDLFIAAHERVGQWSITGIAAPLDADTSGWHPVTVDALTYNGKLYGVPLSYKCLALFYNRALVGSPATTTDALLEQLRPLSGDGRFGLAYESTVPFYVVPWLHGFGGGVYADGPDGPQVALDQPGNAAAMGFVYAMQQDGLVPEEPTSQLVTQLFNDGLAAMVINGPWFLGEIAEDVDFGVAQLPVVSATGQPAAPFLSVEGAIVSGFAAHPAEARQFADYLASPDAALVRATQGRQSVATLAATRAS